MTDSKLRHLRANMTDAEKRLWRALRARQLNGWRFRRQHPLGSYVLDFACIEQCVAVEADGGQHAQSQYDEDRTRWLEGRGWRVLRFWNNDILQNTAGVLDEIARVMEQRGKGA